MKIYIYVMVLFTLGYGAVRYGGGPTLRRLVGPGLYAGVALIYFAGFVGPSPLLLLVIAGLSASMGVRTRTDVACRYALLVGLVPAVSPVFAIGGHVIGQFSAVDAIGFGAVAASHAASQRPKGARARGFRSEEAAILLLILIFGVASVRLQGVSLLVRTILSYVMLLVLPFWVIRRNVRSREELLLVGACVGVSAGILSVLALYEHHAGWAVFDTVSMRMSSGQVGSARTALMRGGALRASTTLASPIEFGLLLTIGLLGTFVSRRLYTKREVWMGLLGLTFVGILTTQSRGALLGCAVGVVVVLLVQRRYALTAAAAGGALALFGLLVALSRSSMRVAAFMGAGKQVGAYKDYRTLLLERGLQEGRKHPIIGTNVNAVLDRLTDLTQGEQIIDLVNTYLHVFLISGLVGLAACALAFTSVYRALWQKVAGPLGSPGELARTFVLAGLTATLVQLAGTSFYGRVVPLLSILLAGARVIRATDRKFYRPPVVPVLWEVGQRAPAPLPDADAGRAAAA